MKKLSASKLFWGIVFIFSALLIILDAVGTNMGFLDGIPIFKTVFVLLLVCVSVTELIKLNFGGFFFPLAIAFMVYEGQIASWLSLENKNIISNWLVLLTAALLSIGCSLLFGKKNFISINNGSKNDHKFSGSSTRNIDCSDFDELTITNELGAYEIHFSNIESYAGNGILTVYNELGAMKIYVPSEWTVKESITNELGSVKTVGSSKGGGKTLLITGANELGSVEIMYI